MNRKIERITKKYAIMVNSCNCHSETCNHWNYSLLKNGDVISQADYIPSLNFPNKNIKFKILDFYQYENHKDTKQYKKWRKKNA
jgi:hypothetical protein